MSCLAGIIVSVFLPAEPLLWEWFQYSTLVSSWRRYFKFSVAIEQKLDPTGKYVFAGRQLMISMLLLCVSCSVIPYTHHSKLAVSRRGFG